MFQKKKYMTVKSDSDKLAVTASGASHFREHKGRRTSTLFHEMLHLDGA